MPDFRYFEPPVIITGSAHTVTHSERQNNGNGEFENVEATDFDYEAVDRCFGVEPDDESDDKVSFSDMSACFGLLLEWVVGKRGSSHPLSLNSIASRALAITSLLSPEILPEHRRTLSDIARETGLSRAAISKSLMELRVSLGPEFGLTIGKLAGSSESYRKAQLAAVKSGNHAQAVCRRLRPSSADARLDACGE